MYTFHEPMKTLEVRNSVSDSISCCNCGTTFQAVQAALVVVTPVANMGRIHGLLRLRARSIFLIDRQKHQLRNPEQVSLRGKKKDFSFVRLCCAFYFYVQTKAKRPRIVLGTVSNADGLLKKILDFMFVSLTLKTFRIGQLLRLFPPCT